MIEVRNLVKKYGNHTAVNNLSFTVEKGQVYGFLGPNGAGKSTTMNIITGYISATKGDVTVLNVIPKHLEATVAKLVEIGCEVEEFDDAVRVRSTRRLRKTHVKTLPYPGYPTDMQPQIAVALVLASGTSTVTESIFENRFKYADELTRMGASIKVEGNTAIIDGVEGLTGARVSALDLRAGAALVIAGLVAEGVTIVDDIVYIQRGYEDFEGKLRSLGAEIEKVTSEKEIQKFKLRVG